MVTTTVGEVPAEVVGEVAAVVAMVATTVGEVPAAVMPLIGLMVREFIIPPFSMVVHMLGGPS